MPVRALATLGAVTELPTDPVGPAWLYIDGLSIFSSVRSCEATFVNAGDEDLVFGDITLEIGTTLSEAPAVVVESMEIPTRTRSARARRAPNS